MHVVTTKKEWQRQHESSSEKCIISAVFKNFRSKLNFVEIYLNLLYNVRTC